MNTKEKFLEEHNKLSPKGMKGTMKMLKIFKEEKPNLFKDDSWSIERIRRPFIFWLSSLSDKEKETMAD